jgi:hypothetical protein
MACRLNELFEDGNLVEKIQRKLPNLFAIAEKESQRAGKTGMEVGSIRERIIIALLIHKFSETNITTNLPITESEVDVQLCGYPISIKSITGNGGVKVVWTVDAKSSMNFLKHYSPTCDIILVKIQKGISNISSKSTAGGLFWIPLDVQRKLLDKIGKENYLKLPKEGTNPRGVELNGKSLLMLLQDDNTKYIPIIWKNVEITYDPYKRWVEYWED